MHIPFFASVLALLAHLVIAYPASNLAAKIAAKPDINVRNIVNAVQHAKKSKIDSYPSTEGLKERIPIYDLHLPDNMSVKAFTAPMAVDCDGSKSGCPGNKDGQPQTSFGKLDAYEVPYYVVPEKFFKNHKPKPNALGAIVCNNKILYGIFGDTNGDNPQVIGEASIGLAQACFPGDHLDGGNGHSKIDVLYIVFDQQVPEGVRKDSETIDLAALKKLGDKQMNKLSSALKIGQ